MRRSVSLVLASAFSLSLASAATITVARADVKVVTKVTTTGVGGFGGGGFGGGFRRGGNQGGADGAQAAPPAAPSPSQTFTTYFKGRKARTESADGSKIVIYDRDADKIYTLDPKAKTYYSTDYKTVTGETPTPANNFVRQETKVGLREPAAGAAAATIGGVATRAFSIDGTQTMSVNAAAFGGRGGANGNAQGGNAQAGGNAQGGGRRGGFGGFGGMSTAITGSISLANASAVLPTELAGAPYDRTLVLPLLGQLQPVGDQVFKPLMASIARYQSVPLAAKITLQRSIQMTAPANGGDAPASPPTIPPTTITMEVQSIDKTATLDNALFSVPTDFTVVEAPQPRGWGRGGGQGGQGGQNGQGGGGRQRRQRNGAGGAAANQNPVVL